MNLKQGTILLVVLLSIWLESVKSEDKIAWKKKPSAGDGGSIDFNNTKLLLQTKAEKGNMRINFKDSQGNDAGGFLLDLTKSKYGFLGCTDVMSATEELKTSLPKPDNAGYRIFVIETYGREGQGLKISNNGTALITFQPSKESCSGWRWWDEKWTRNKVKLDFKFDWAISDYAKVPFEECRKLNSTLRGVTTDPALPVKHRTEVSLRCPAGTINRGGSKGVCEDGVIVALNSTPVCKGIYPVPPTVIPRPVVTTEALQNIDWKKKPFASDGGSIDFSNTKLLLQTKAEKGNMRINFKDSQGNDAGGFLLDLTKSKYGFLGCTDLMSATEELKTSLPKPGNAGHRIFVIETYGWRGQGLKISCNDTVLITFEPSKESCSGWHRWDKIWNKKKAKLDFKFDWVISDYAKVPYRAKKKDQYVKTKR